MEENTELDFIPIDFEIEYLRDGRGGCYSGGSTCGGGMG